MRDTGRVRVLADDPGRILTLEVGREDTGVRRGILLEALSENLDSSLARDDAVPRAKLGTFLSFELVLFILGVDQSK